VSGESQKPPLTFYEGIKVMRYLLILFLLSGCMGEPNTMTAQSSSLSEYQGTVIIENGRPHLYIDDQRYIQVTTGGGNIVWKAH